MIVLSTVGSLSSRVFVSNGQAPVSKVVVTGIPTPSALVFQGALGQGVIVVASSSTDKLFVLHSGSGTGTYSIGGNFSFDVSPVALVWDSVDGNYYSGNLPGTVLWVDGDYYGIDGSANVPSPVGLTYDQQHDLIFAASSTSNEIYVINASSAAVLSTISVCCTPTSLAYDSENGYLYVAESAANTVAVVNPQNSSIMANITVGSSPQYIIDEGPVLYVANYGSNTVSAINVARDNVETINVSSEPDSIAYNSYNGCYYVTDYGSNAVSEICEGSVAYTIAVGSEPDAVIYDPLEYSILVGNYGSGTISEITTPGAPSLPTTTIQTTLGNTSQSTSSASSSTSTNATAIATASSISSGSSSSTAQTSAVDFVVSPSYLAIIAIVVILISEFGLLAHYMRKRPRKLPRWAF